jgi:hypothetical protein
MARATLPQESGMRNKLVNMQAITRVPVALIFKHAEVPQERVGFVVGGRIAMDNVRHRQHVKAVALFRLTVAPKIFEPDTTEDNEGCNRAESARGEVSRSVSACSADVQQVLVADLLVRGEMVEHQHVPV